VEMNFVGKEKFSVTFFYFLILVLYYCPFFVKKINQARNLPSSYTDFLTYFLKFYQSIKSNPVCFDDVF